MPAAARLTDDQSCPKAPSGPLDPVDGDVCKVGQSTVKIAFQYAAREGDGLTCTCGSPDHKILQGTGAQTVIIAGKPAARLGDATNYKGVLISGAPTVRIGDTTQGVTLLKAGAPLVEPCDDPPPGGWRGGDLTV